MAGSVRWALALTVLVGLGCSGASDLRRDANAELRAEARTKFVAACSKAGPDGNPVSNELCTCVADEILASHTTKELLQFAARPSARELVPTFELCTKRLVGSK